ncbi:hypothetical protein DSO57_1004243 [Entomophthora muscae]|uniref:Uncharacterized protein n=1 Tax=Entomophthora muscae TaxID=34485 RepID=A0ACC2SAD0_9FUNG|nr:hypothetical protein DSO57_1004243 [Entomophthora muscae]
MEWAASGIPIDLAKAWRAMAFLPNKAVDWANKGFCPKDARRWALIGISPAEARALKEAHWNPDNVHLWGPFKEWTLETATNWKTNRYTPVEMKYWLGQGLSMEEAKSWQTVGVTTQLHRTLNNKKITVTEWELWRHTTSLADAVMWIQKDFKFTTAEQWMNQKISPKDTAFLAGKIPPEEATEWLQAKIAAEQILIWKSILPDAEAAGLFANTGFTPEKKEVGTQSR